MKKIIAIDPGTVKSAYVILDESYNIEDKDIMENNRLAWFLTEIDSWVDFVIEMVASYGMPVGREIFETAYWTGRFVQAHEPKTAGRIVRVYRKDIKLWFCNSLRAKDSNIRQVLIDRFGAPGTKKSPGKLYGVKKDIWAALAVGVWYLDTKEARE